LVLQTFAGRYLMARGLVQGLRCRQEAWGLLYLGNVGDPLQRPGDAVQIPFLEEKAQAVSIARDRSDPVLLPQGDIPQVYQGPAYTDLVLLCLRYNQASLQVGQSGVIIPKVAAHPTQ